MRIITVVGKIDSRALVYPLARALSLNGQTAIIADDGAYRRLFRGTGDIGTVSGVDIGVTSHIDESAVHLLDKSGINYDNIIVVSSDYIYPESTGIIACHGLDRSMMAIVEEEEDDDFILPLKSDTEEPKDTPKVKVGGLLGKGKQKKQEDTDTQANETKETEIKDSEADKDDKVEIAEMTNPAERDQIVIPDNIPFAEVQIAYAAAPKKDIPGISLKDSLTSYIYNCEEEKKLNVVNDKILNSTLSKIASTVTKIEASEFLTLLTREEGKTPAKKR